MSSKKTLEVSLNQKETNLILLALELYGETSSLNGQSKTSDEAKRLWDKFFDEGLNSFSK